MGLFSKLRSGPRFFCLPIERNGGRSDLWIPPPSGSLALSCDSFVSNSEDHARCGELFQNALGDVMFAFTHKLDRCSILEAEL